MRLFVAAEPSREVQAAAAACADRLRARLDRLEAAAAIRWIPGSHLHLTVWFVGHVREPAATAVLDVLRPPMKLDPFILHLGGLGAFPPTGSPRVLWMGVIAGAAELGRAHDEIAVRLRPLGFTPEGRSYSPHLTIARVKSPPRGRGARAMRAALDAEPADAGACRIEVLTVFESRTSPHGAVYEPLLRVPLS